jgi:hypothetical protein
LKEHLSINSTGWKTAFKCVYVIIATNVWVTDTIQVDKYGRCTKCSIRSFYNKEDGFLHKVGLRSEKKQRGGTCLIPLDASYTFNMFYTIFERQHNYPKKE